MSAAAWAQARTQPANGTSAAEISSRLSRAAAAADSGRLNEARAEYERVIKQGGAAQIEGDFDQARRLGLCYLNGSPQKLGEAARWLEAANRVRPNDADVSLYLAQSYAWSGRHDDAIRVYSGLRSRFPNNADYVIGLANAQFGKGDTGGALDLLQRFTQTAPSNIAIRLLYARFLGYSKQYVQSIAQYQQILQVDPRNVEANVGVAKVTSWQGDNDTALQLYDKVLKSEPRNYDALVGKAYSLLWLGRKTEARQLFATVNARNPGDREIAATLKSLPAPEPPPQPIVAETRKPEPAPEPVKEPTAAEPVQTTVAKAEEAPAVEPAPVPVAPAEPTKEERVAAMMTQAEASAGAQNYAEAVHRYHEALAIDPDNRAAAFQLARVLSWSKAYGDSVLAYDEVLAKHPQDLAAQAERARVLSWAKRYPESLTAYDAAIKTAESCSGSDCISPRALRIEYARVLSWAGRYTDALAQYQQLQLSPDLKSEEDRAAALDRARVLAWSRRYDESRAQYEQVEQAGGDSFEARLGKAQVTYWSGNVRDAAIQLRRLSVEKPKDPTVALTLAAVEHNLGYNARALSLLSVAEPGMEADSLKETIRKDLKPVVRFRYGYENDLEVESNATESTIKVLRYTSSAEFNIHPDVRMQVLNTFTNGLTSNALLGKHAGDTWAQETLARFTFRVAPWMTLTAGAGVGTSGGYRLGADSRRIQHPLFELHPVINAQQWRIDLAVARRVAEYTPLAIADNVVQTRLTAAVSRRFGRFTSGAEYWHGFYQVDSPEPALGTKYSAEGNGGSLYVTGSAYRSDRFTADLGMRYESFGFDQGGEHISDPGIGIGSAGFFTPRLYQRYAGTSTLALMPSQAWRFDLGGSFGPQRVFGFGELSAPPANWGTTGSLDVSSTYTHKAWSFTAGYNFFSTETASAPGQKSGAYQSHGATMQLTYRF